MKRGNQPSCAALSEANGRAGSPSSATASPPTLPSSLSGTGHRRRLVDGVGLVRRRRHNVAALILAEPQRVGRQGCRNGVELDADTAGHRHLGDRHQQAAVGHVVHAVDAAIA